MRRSNLKLTTIAAILVIFSLCSFYAAYAATSKTLKKDTELTPVNWPASKKLLFKSGTISVDGHSGMLVSGVIAKNYVLGIYGNIKKEIEFAGGKQVTFESAGGVKKGWLAFDTPLYIAWTKTEAVFKGGTAVEFGYNGGVIGGTLAKDAQLAGTKSVIGTYKAGASLKFDGAGNVASSSYAPVISVSYAGKYKGSFSGSSSGTINATAEADGGFIATLYYTKEKLSVDVTGTVDKNGNINCSMGGGEYKGKFKGTESCSGSWKFGKMKGVWTAKKEK